jgi:hypothetical protein
MGYLWGALSYISFEDLEDEVIQCMPLLKQYLSVKHKIPWSLMNKLMKYHIS